MGQISLRLPDELIEELDGEADDQDVSRSKHIRDALESRHDQRRELAEREREIERLNRERRQLLEQRSENKELRRYVEDEQRYRGAGLVQRVRWFFRGMD